MTTETKAIPAWAEAAIAAVREAQAEQELQVGGRVLKNARLKWSPKRRAV